MMRACKPMSSDLVDATVFVANVMFRPEPVAVPIANTGATHGSASVPDPVTVTVPAPIRPTRWPSQFTIGADAPPCNSDANQLLIADGSAGYANGNCGMDASPKPSN
jgi:hypothetical protein